MNTITSPVKSFIEAIKEAILSTNTALLTNSSTEILKLQNQIIETIHVDDNGNIWCVARKPQQQIAQFHPHFPVMLQYFRKGVPVSASIKGTASIMQDPEAIAGFEQVFFTRDTYTFNSEDCSHNSSWHNSSQDFYSEHAVYQRYKNDNSYILLHIVVESAIIQLLHPAEPNALIVTKEWFSNIVAWIMGEKRLALYGKKWSLS